MFRLLCAGVLLPALAMAVAVDGERQLVVARTEERTEEQEKFVGETTFCWKDSYGRGVGKIPGKCAPNEDRIGLLCYPKCHTYDYTTSAGRSVRFSRFGFDCHQRCPSGFSNQGLYCRKAEYGRGAGRSPCTGCTGCTGCSWGGCSGCSGWEVAAIFAL